MTPETRARHLERLLPSAQIALFRGTPDPLSELPVGQVRLIRSLGGGPQSPSMLAHALGLTPGAISQLAARLKAAGLVVEMADPDDRRMKRLALSRSGEAMVTERAMARMRRVETVLAHLSEPEQVTLIDSLERLLEAAVCSPTGPGPQGTHR